MITVQQLLKEKGRDIWSIAPQASVYEALQLMADKNAGALLVLDNGKLVGIFSERDYARKGILKNKSSKDTPVSALMTKKICVIDSQATMETCMHLMTDKHIRHLPVTENDQLVGVISIGDVVKQVISDQKFTIQELEKYISGSYA